MYVASLILGLLSLILCWVPVVGTLLAIVALVISIIAVCKKEDEKSERGMSIAGLVLSSISIIVSIFVIVFVIIFFNVACDIGEDIITNFKNSEIGEFIGAEAKLLEKYSEVEFKNQDKLYTGYIDRNTGEYVEKGQGMEINEYYEEYLENNGYDVDVYVNKRGEPIIEESF